MAAQTVIKLRRDTAANWTSANPTLAAGEQGYETDTGKVKIGNGSTAWTSLSYSNPGGAIAPSQVTGTAVITTDSRLSDSRTPTAHTHAIADLTDFQITSAVTGQLLSYNGTKWVNAAAPASGFDSFMLMGA
jgi:hypothetical protein